ncbi:FABP family protein [Rhodococcus sp. X156]|uniref:FABP family protein n=1 Tax=Rhodococcus sp. X156 TaxID=2499145 RepID=UPI001F497C7D|nr:FABP family protein [Rhodococcus sp. X156]
MTGSGPGPDGHPAPRAGSGDAALRDAEERAARTRAVNVPQLPGLPVPDDTANLREGADLNAALLAVLPLVGVWRGEGLVSYPTIDTYRFGQQLVIAHDGRPFLTWESRSWILDADGAYVRPAARESGFLRVNARDDGEDTLELLLTHNTGIVELYYGAPLNQSSWELATDVVLRSETAKPVTAAKRLYGIIDGDLGYVDERAMMGEPLQPHLSARLVRHAG